MRRKRSFLSATTLSSGMIFPVLIPSPTMKRRLSFLSPLRSPATTSRRILSRSAISLCLRIQRDSSAPIKVAKLMASSQTRMSPFFKKEGIALAIVEKPDVMIASSVPMKLANRFSRSKCTSIVPKPRGLS
eukprot:29172_1